MALALVALQALSSPADRAVVTSTRNMLRALGSAIGVAVSTSVQYGVMKLTLPSQLPQDIRAQVLVGSWKADEFRHSQWTDGILESKMRGTQVVFITFVPLMALCLLGCVFVREVILLDDLDNATSNDRRIVNETSKV